MGGADVGFVEALMRGTAKGVISWTELSECYVWDVGVMSVRLSVSPCDVNLYVVDKETYKRRRISTSETLLQELYDCVTHNDVRIYNFMRGVATSY